MMRVLKTSHNIFKQPRYPFDRLLLTFWTCGVSHMRHESLRSREWTIGVRQAHTWIHATRRARHVAQSVAQQLVLAPTGTAWVVWCRISNSECVGGGPIHTSGFDDLFFSFFQPEVAGPLRSTRPCNPGILYLSSCAGYVTSTCSMDRYQNQRLIILMDCAAPEGLECGNRFGIINCINRSWMV